MSNPDQTNPQLQTEEEHKNNVQLSQTSTTEEHKVDENKKEKRIKKKGFKKLHTIAQELQHEYKKFFKISYADETLNIRGFQKRVTDKVLEELLSTLSKRLEENKITLKGLNLNLKKFRLLTDAGFESIISRFGTTFKNLEYLNLDLNMYGRNQVSEETMIKLINHSLHLQNLKHLNLNPYFYYFEENDINKQIINNLLPNLKSIRTLNITPAFNYSTKEKDILEYVRAITSLPHLENLTVDLRHYQLSEQGFTEIANQISNNLPDLKHLSLKFAHNENMSDKSLINFFRVIGPGLKKLETLEVSLKNRKQNNITDQVLESLASKFSDNFQSLKSLVLNFEGCNKLTSEGVSKFAKSIGTNLKNLKHLDLNFNGLFHLDDEAIPSFAYLNNEHLPELESLKLAIAGAKITDQGLKDFLAAFEGKSENIKELSLDVSGCKQLSEKSIKLLGTHIFKTFKNLKSLKLILRNYKQILTPQMKAFLAKSFKSIPKYELTIGTLY